MTPDRNWTILIVEAEPSVQGLLSRCLIDDYRVLTAGSGRAAMWISME